MSEKVKLDGGPQKTVTWIWIEAGGLKVEYYDFSELEERQTAFERELESHA
jgi:hypothetical protein